MGTLENIVAGTAVVASIPLSMWGFSYVGEGMGWVVGQVVDVIPYVRDVAPWLVERTGLITNPEDYPRLNIDFYQAKGAVAGFWSGLGVPIKIAAEFYKD